MKLQKAAEVNIDEYYTQLLQKLLATTYREKRPDDSEALQLKKSQKMGQRFKAVK